MTLSANPEAARTETQDIIGLILVYGIIACSLVAMLLCERKEIDVDVRKIIHAGVGFFVFVWWMFTAEWIMLAFFTLPFLAIVLLAMFDGNPVSGSKLGSISNDMGHRIGLLVYVLSINILVLFFFDGHWTAATLGAVAMTFGDSAGSAIGRRFGKHKTINGKSLEGSIGVLAATALMSAAVMNFYTFLNGEGLYSGDVVAIVPIWAVCITAGFIAMLSELLCPGRFDNLSNSMTVAVAMCLVGL